MIIPWNKGKKHSKETIEKIKEKRKNQIFSEETRKKMSLSHIGINTWMKGKKLSDETKIKISKKNKGINNWQKGRKHSLETRKKMSEKHRGEKAPAWKGGITPINKLIRCSLEYRLWRESVFTRDKYTCIFCGEVGKKLNADHIKPFALYPELRFAIDNGRTLCEECHKKTDTFGYSKLYKAKALKDSYLSHEVPS